MGKVTGADSKMGFLGKAGLIVGAAVAGSMLEGHIKKGKKGKKSKKNKKSKSRELNVGERGIAEEDSDSNSSSSGEESLEQAPETPSGPSTNGRPRCEFGKNCFRRIRTTRSSSATPATWSGLSLEAVEAHFLKHAATHFPFYKVSLVTALILMAEAS